MIRFAYICFSSLTFIGVQSYSTTGTHFNDSFFSGGLAKRMKGMNNFQEGIYFLIPVNRNGVHSRYAECLT